MVSPVLALLCIWHDSGDLHGPLNTQGTAGHKRPKGKRIARWILDIWTYEFTLLHRKGKNNLDADALGRMEIQNNITHIASQTALTVEELIKAQRNDPELQQIINTGIIEYPYILMEGVLCVVIYLIIPTVWRQAFLKRIHEYSTSGHLGRDKTLARAKDNGFWVVMNADVKNYVSKCVECQKLNCKAQKYKNLQSIQVGAPRDRWAADIAYLPTTKGGRRYLLVMMEYLTKWVITVPLVSAAAYAIENALTFEIILEFGNPKELLTDNDTNFISETVNIT
ncbi:hypothetical protein [Parasitella parasitica]|uniref:Integrase catalytic domain-containing protein n=1 Tax=Parasitella parasitica TaxID=35722 RepID=A0A0B7NRC4_9FUNG|nr:hypothetical protein [Parasitella parasitica]